jgi:cation transport ATPase
VLTLGLVVFAVWTAADDWRTGLQAMISVYVVSCPCALGVAVPLADEWAAARLARAGAFVRRASLWPRLRRVKHVIFDKTGTLSLERPVLENPQAGDAPEKVVALAAALGLPHGSAVGGLSPQDKAARVAALDRENTLFVGDAANDSLAFDAAFVTATPVVDRSLLESKADFYALGSALTYLTEALAAADARTSGVRRALVFALSYNFAS